MLIRFYLLASSKSESRFIKLIRKKIHYAALLGGVWVVLASMNSMNLWFMRSMNMLISSSARRVLPSRKKVTFHPNLDDTLFCHWFEPGRE